MSGKLVILSGPSGVGKDTLIDRWSARNSRVVRVVAYTTRAPRVGEVDGRDYHFVNESSFLAKAEAGEFLEHKEVHGKRYATPLRETLELLAQGQIAILKIDVQGAETAKARYPEAITIFLRPPSLKALRSRIVGRGLDDPEVIERRLKNAEAELAEADRYDHQVVNDDLDRALSEIEAILEQRA